MRKLRSRIIGLAVLMALILGAIPETMAKDKKDNCKTQDTNIGIDANNYIATTASDTLNIKRGYKADRFKHIASYELEQFGFIGGEFSRIKSSYTWSYCCTPTGNKMDGCSAIIICPKYTKEKG